MSNNTGHRKMVQTQMQRAVSGLSCIPVTANCFILPCRGATDSVCSSSANNTGFTPEKHERPDPFPPEDPCSDYQSNASFVRHGANSIHRFMGISSSNKSKIISFVHPLDGCIVLQPQTTTSGGIDDAYLLEIAQ